MSEKANVFRCESCGKSCLGSNLLEGYKCPQKKCGSEDIFMLRMFQCTACTHKGEGIQFFKDYDDADLDPLEIGLTSICPNDKCAKLDTAKEIPVQMKAAD